MLQRLERGRFFGEARRTFSSGKLVFADVEYAPARRLPRHVHERAYFCLIREGRYRESYGRRARECGPLTVAFHPAGEPHEQVFGEERVRSFNVEIGSDWLDQRREPGATFDQAAEFHGGRVAALALRLFEDFSMQAPAAELESAACDVVACIGGALTDGPALRQPAWLGRARQLLDESFQEPPAIAGLAAEAGVHPVYFAATFRRFQGCSVADYIRRRRVQYARAQLREPERTLADIAAMAGFADQSHFTRTFKRSTGMTPGEYRTFLRFKTNP